MVDYRAIATQAAESAGIDPAIFVAQINQESGFNPNALSPAGAEGIAQFMPATAQGLGIDPYNPVQALQAAAKLDARNLSAYGGDWSKALAAYNAGGGAVNSWISQFGSNWLSHAYSETQHYVASILKASGSSGVTPVTSTIQSTISQTGSNSVFGVSSQGWQQFMLVVFGGLVVLMGVVILFVSKKSEETSQ